MFAIYIVTLLALMRSEILPSRVQSHSSYDDDNYCKTTGQAVEIKIKQLQGKKDLPQCVCGLDGTISKVDIFNANSGKTTTVLTCSGCTGLQVSITSSTECKNVPDVFHPYLDELCQIVHPRCKSITVYRCGCQAEITTEVFTIPMQTTTVAQPPPETTTFNPESTTTAYVTKFNEGGYSYSSD